MTLKHFFVVSSQWMQSMGLRYQFTGQKVQKVRWGGDGIFFLEAIKDKNVTTVLDSKWTETSKSKCNSPKISSHDFFFFFLQELRLLCFTSAIQAPANRLCFVKILKISLSFSEELLWTVEQTEITTKKPLPLTQRLNTGTNISIFISYVNLNFIT